MSKTGSLTWLQGLLPDGELDRRDIGLRERLDEDATDLRMAAALSLAERYARGYRPAGD
jgi:hypothetical protein